MTSTLHALDHVSRLVEALADDGLPGQPGRTPHDFRATELCTRAMSATQVVGGSITSESALSAQAAPIGWSVSSEVATALAAVEDAAGKLDSLQRDYRAATLSSVAPGKLTAAEALTRIDTARRLDGIVNHAWRSAAHLLGRGTPDNVQDNLLPSSQPESATAGRHEDAAS